MNRPGFAGGSNFQRGWSHDEQNDEQVFTWRCASVRCGWCWITRRDYSSRWTACQSIATKIGCIGAHVAGLGEEGGDRCRQEGRMCRSSMAAKPEGAGAREPGASPGQRDPAQGFRIFLPRRSSTARSNDDRVHRRSPRGRTGSSRSARCCRSPRRPTTTTSPNARIPETFGAGEAGPCAEARRSERVFAENCRGLWRAQGLAADAARGLRCRALHRRTVDGRTRPSRRHPRQACPHHGAGQGRPVPARPCEPGLSCPGAEHALAVATLPMSAPGRASSTWPSSSTPIARSYRRLAGEQRPPMRASSSMLSRQALQ